MKAAVYSKYGSPDVIQIKELEKPSPGDNEVLIKVSAASVNMSDYELLTGKPLFTRIFGLFKPRTNILGSDIAGTVEKIGRNIKNFKPGDEVFGDIFESFGGFAEYVCVPEKMLMIKPSSITFQTAAAIPQAGAIALQGIRDKGCPEPGDKILVNGAGGGAGSFAVQIARYFGAEVTGVDRAEKLAFIKSIGADHVIDYENEDFTKNGKHYDLILDLAAYHSVIDYKRSLSRKGRYLMVGGSMSMIFQLLTAGTLISLFSGRKMGLLALKTNSGLDFINELILSNRIKPVIYKELPLDDISEALRCIGNGEVSGKLIISLVNKK